MKPGEPSMGVIMGMGPKPQKPDNPLQAFKVFDRKQTSARAQKDQEIWHKWDQGGRQPKDLAPLIRRFKPFIESRMRAWKPPHVPEAAFRDEIKKKLYEGAETYEPDKGAVSTHFFTRAGGATRFGKRRANAMYIPEKKTQYIGPLMSAKDELRDDLGRDPTNNEIHGYMAKHRPDANLRPKDINTILGAMRKDVLSSAFESDPNPTSQARHIEISGPLVRQAIEVEYLRGQKKRRDSKKSVQEALKVYDMMFTPDGNPTGTKPGQIAKNLGKHPSHVSRVRSRIIDINKKYI